MKNEIEALISDPNYPCIAAKIAIKQKQFEIHSYGTMGSGRLSSKLACDLDTFRQHYDKTNNRYLSFFAVFEQSTFESEDEFETALWKELSLLARDSRFTKDGDPKFSDKPSDKNFCFSLNGYAYFVVGMHPLSSRKARRLSHPTLVFNLYQQFEDLDEETEFYPMVQSNRKRELIYAGSLNPMVEQYAEKWESIQFSGKNNPPDWKCPFSRGQKDSL